MTCRARVVARKELVEIMRDRRVILFVILLPILTFPLLISGVMKFAGAQIEKRTTQRVVIAADDAARQAYLRMGHEWFLSSDIGRGMRLTTWPVLGKILLPKNVGEANGDGALKIEIPPEIFREPEALRNWMRATIEQAAESATEFSSSNFTAMIDSRMMERIPNSVIEEGKQFYQVVIQGMAMVDFVDPATLPDPPSGWQPESVPSALEGRENMTRIAWAIKNREIHGFLEMQPDWDALVANHAQQGPVTLVHDSTIGLSDEARSRVKSVTEAAGDLIVKRRLASLSRPPVFLRPVRMTGGANLASAGKQAISAVAGFLPYMIIVFSYLGGLAVSIDMGAGEKERNTLETLLLSGASRFELALGKFIALFIVIITSAMLSVASLTATALFIVPAQILSSLDIRVEPLNMLMIATLVMPVAATFAAVFFLISMYARSSKEAGTYNSPLSFILILPALAALMPGTEMSLKLALIPLVNVSMLMREFMKGEVYWGYYGITMAISLAVAALALAIAVWQFSREKVLFRS